MSFVELIRLAFGTLLSHKLRSVLTTLGVLIGVMTVIGMLALISGLNSLVSSQLASIGSDNLYVQKFSFVMNRDEFIRARNRRNLTLDDAEAIERQVTLARRVAPLLNTFITARAGNQSLDGVQLMGTTPEYQFITQFDIETGRQMTAVDQQQSRMVAIIGATLVEKLFSGQNPVGRTIIIGAYHFQIIATLQKRGSIFGADQDNIIIIPITAYSKFFSGVVTPFGSPSVTIIVQPLNTDVIEPLKDQIITILRQRRRVPPGQENDFSINTPEQLLQVYRAITSGVFGLMIGVTALSLIVGGIGIMNIMLVSVSERIREIGIRKAVGARRRDILSQFLIEAVVLSCIGGIIGMVLGFLLATAVSALINLPAAVTPWSVALGFGFSALVGIFFGWYPARRAAAMNPIEALRHE